MSTTRAIATRRPSRRQRSMSPTSSFTSASCGRPSPLSSDLSIPLGAVDNVAVAARILRARTRQARVRGPPCRYLHRSSTSGPPPSEKPSGCWSGWASSARLVAGGHSLLPMMKLRLANFEYLIDINDLHGELGYITVEPNQIRIGALTRHRELLESRRTRGRFPDLPRRRTGDRRSSRSQSGHDRRVAVPGGSVRGSVRGVHDARRQLRDP